MEVPLLNDVYFYPEHWQPNESTEVVYRMPLPLAMPPSDYQLGVELIDANSAAQLPVLAENGRFAGIKHPISIVELSPSDNVMSATRVTVENSMDAAWDSAGLRLLGFGELGESVVTGADLPIDLVWQATEKIDSEWQVGLQIGDVVVKRPLSRWPVTSWRDGEVIREKYLVPVPVELAAGDYPVQVSLLDESGEGVGETAVLDTITVNQLDRIFSPPDDIQTPLDFQFHTDVQLLGVNAVEQVSRGKNVDLTLYWQVNQKPQVLYNAFVHLIGPDGEIVAQADRWPGGLPTDLWVAGQVIVDEYGIELPADAPAGDYQVVVGVYTAVDGTRLTVTDAGGNVIGDQISLPILIEVGE